MVFSSFQFLFVFLPMFMLLYAFIRVTRWRNYLILAFSLAFYVWGEKGYVVILLLSIVSTWPSGYGLKATAPRPRANACWPWASSSIC
jgi:alginate O-acetyltransferase complex protein AlgI